MPAMDDLPTGTGAEPAGPHGCRAAIIVRGEYHWCDMVSPHDGWPHSSTPAGAIWRGIGPDGIAEDAVRPAVRRYGSLDELRADVDDPGRC